MKSQSFFIDKNISNQETRRVSKVVPLENYTNSFYREATKRRKALGLGECVFTVPCLKSKEDKPIIPNCPLYSMCKACKDCILP